MKKLLLCFVVVALSTTAFAQKKSTFGVRAGLDISNVSMKMDGESLDLKSRVGFNVGISYQTPLVSKLYLETGLNLTSRGARLNSISESISDGYKLNMLYVQLPVALSWHFDLKNISIQPFVGGYYSIGVQGKMKMDDSDTKIDVFKKPAQDEEGPSTQFRRSDAGLRFGVGVEFCKKYYVSLGYDLGLSNLLKDKEARKMATIKNNNFAITLGYNF